MDGMLHSRIVRLDDCAQGDSHAVTCIFPSVHHTKAMLPLSDPAPREYNFEHISPLW